MNKRCINCLNDKTVKNISFNKDGLCNFCETYLNEYDKWHDFNKLEEIFLKRLASVKGKYTYDVCIPFSGGKDSTYVLYQMVKKYNVSLIAFTLDNGFLSDEAKDKINCIVKELGVKHEYVTIDDEFIRHIYHEFISKFLSPCIPCSYMGYALMINYASKVNAGLIIHGRSRAQMFRNYATNVADTMKPFIDVALMDPKTIDLAKLYDSVLGKVNKYINPLLAKEMNECLLKDTKINGYREFIGYFLYHDYDQTKIIEEISLNTSWKVKKEAEHFDCLIHNGAKYLKDMIAKRPHDLPEISFLIRDKKISKEDAKRHLEQELNANTTTAKKEIKLMCDYARISEKKLMLKTKIYAKRWW